MPNLPSNKNSSTTYKNRVTMVIDGGASSKNNNAVYIQHVNVITCCEKRLMKKISRKKNIKISGNKNSGMVCSCSAFHNIVAILY